jgi:dethiobiotin synthetase
MAEDALMNGLFFTGTDTGVGKTFVACAIARILRRQGHEVAACKPVATGAVRQNGGWINEDTLALAEAAGLEKFPERVTPWTFPDPVAPAVAARRAGVDLRLSDIVKAVNDLRDSNKVMLIEGVGGLLCPLTERETVADLVAMLGMRLVVVARRSLGTLNHTLLTLEVARSRSLQVAGVIVNETTPPHSLAEETNLIELEKRIQVPLLATVPYRSGKESRAPPCLEAIDWWKLCQAG